MGRATKKYQKSCLGQEKLIDFIKKICYNDYMKSKILYNLNKEIAKIDYQQFLSN